VSAPREHGLASSVAAFASANGRVRTWVVVPARLPTEGSTLGAGVSTLGVDLLTVLGEGYKVS
jgi:hypothetical protein